MEKDFAELERLEDNIRKSDGDALRARWASRRALLNLKGDKKQLPKGALAELTTQLRVCRSELGARMAFATRYHPRMTWFSLCCTFLSGFWFGWWFAFRTMRQEAKDREEFDRQVREARGWK